MFSWIRVLFTRFLAWFATTRAWAKFARHWMGYFTFRVFGYTKFPLEKYFDILKKFDESPDGIYAFVSGDQSSLSYKFNHLLTDCQWSHAGIIKKEDGHHLRAWHMKGNGLNHWHLLEILRACDRFALLRMPIEGENIAIANSRLDAIVTAPLVPYDFSFQMPQEIIDWLTKGMPLSVEDKGKLQALKLYCSEMDYVIGAGLVEPGHVFATHWDLGSEVFEPDDIYTSCDVVYEYRAA